MNTEPNDQTDPNMESTDKPSVESLDLDGVELSLNELGRAYAKAVGLVPDQQAAETETESNALIDDDAACELSPRSILEALLFVGSSDPGEYLTSNQVASLIRDVTVKEVNQLARQLQQEYEQQGHAFRLVREKNRLWLELADEYELVRENFYGEIRKARLSQPAIDVLAIVAYHQPVTRDRVNELRSRECGSILNQLVKRNLVAAHSSEPASRVKEYTTTDRFLELFELESIEDLPQSEDALIPE